MRTRADHDAVEAHPHQRRLLTAPLEREFLCTLLAATARVHVALEDALEHAKSSDPRVAAMWQPYHVRSAGIADDVRSLGGDPDAIAVPEVVDRYARSVLALDPVALVGHWYVFEGATNGGRHLVRTVLAALGDGAPTTLRAFDPYGADQPRRWNTFRNGLDNFGHDPEGRARCVQGARDAFAFHRALFDARVGA